MKSEFISSHWIYLDDHLDNLEYIFREYRKSSWPYSTYKLSNNAYQYQHSMYHNMWQLHLKILQQILFQQLQISIFV